MEERLSAAGGEILAELRAGVATVILNRPAALNALTFGMFEALAGWFDDWAADERVRVVLLKGAGERAFCAGGDIRALRESFLAGSGQHIRLFEIEYALDCRIHRYPKPVVALMDGIVMGGGMGLAQGAALRIAGPRTRLAMPETAIGLFPDVGGTYFLPRTPGNLGQYLGLVGPTLGSADALYAGLADVSFTPGIIAELEAELSRAAASPEPREAIAAFARRSAVPLPAGELESLRPAIDLHFGRQGVAAIIASLQSENRPEYAPWAQKTLALLERRSPTLLRVAHEQIKRGAHLSLADAFRLELGLVHACFAQGDFLEGIRALIVDKDNGPRWNPPSLGEVTDASVASFFAPRWAPSEHPLAFL
jgi:enoyl-CoA hydratase/carnithine racemase